MAAASSADGDHVLILTSGGYGKRTAMDQFRDQKRGGIGVKSIKLTKVRGIVAGARAVTKGMEVFVIASNGVAIRTKVDSVSRQKREASGVKVIRLPEGVSVSAFAPVENDEE